MIGKEDLLNYLCEKSEDRLLIEPIIDEFLFLESQLIELKKKPFIKYHPDNPYMQKNTPAGKLYKDLLQQYINIYRTLSKIKGGSDDEKENLLAKWIKQRLN